MDSVPFTGPAYACGARVIERVQRIGAAVELYVDPSHFMLCGPLDSVLQYKSTPDINSDPIAQTHQLSPIISVRCTPMRAAEHQLHRFRRRQCIHKIET
jgi:hypothetical protein